MQATKTNAPADPREHPARAPACPPTSGPPVLFVCVGQARPAMALRRAAELAERLLAPLHVLRVVPPLSRGHVAFLQDHRAEALRAAERHLEADRATHAWCARILTDQLPAPWISIRQGGLLVTVTRMARDLGARLVVLASSEGARGTLVTDLAGEAQVPVFVVRRRGHSPVILVATDLADARYPVVRRSAALAADLEAPVAFVHNVSPVPPLAMIELVPLALVDAGSELAMHRLERLRSIGHALASDAEVVVTRSPLPDQAILEVARKREADLVVVGTHGRSWFGRLLQRSVANRVVSQARRSVLVIPIGRPEGQPPAARLDLRSPAPDMSLS